ncbi:hypothetical protein BpHYR1_041802 [Brachionus plicatilis]|uniref:Uncharacterized protein n=1 Tax=Brachionus plicatilis TaxID=10195 RepID=A0A3M7QLJ8_BRAPC|nr:hypothetical protein BpHYR1_041802 [Brachionus plicatilis]
MSYCLFDCYLLVVLNSLIKILERGREKEEERKEIEEIKGISTRRKEKGRNQVPKFEVEQRANKAAGAKVERLVTSVQEKIELLHFQPLVVALRPSLSCSNAHTAKFPIFPIKINTKTLKSFFLVRQLGNLPMNKKRMLRIF